MSKTKKNIIYIIIGIAILVNIIPVDRTNPPVKNEIQANKQVMKILKKSCYDCHSNETIWPFYSYIAPVSWIVAGHVANGRRHLNFSEWDESKSVKMLEEIKHEIEENKMPLQSYTFLHKDSELNTSKKTPIYEWIEYRNFGEK